LHTQRTDNHAPSQILRFQLTSDDSASRMRSTAW